MPTMGQKLSVGFRAVLCVDPNLSPSPTEKDVYTFADWTTSFPCKKCSTPHLADDADRPLRLDTVLYDRPPADRATRLRHGWNPADRSPNLSIIRDSHGSSSAGDDDGSAGLTVHRHPVAQSTDAVRGRVGHVRGLHVYEIHWPRRLRGTHASVGVATAAAPLRCGGYWSLVGADSESWGWDVARNRLVHGGPLGLSAARGTCIAGSPIGGTPTRRGNNNCNGSGRGDRGTKDPETGERAYPSTRPSPFQTTVASSTNSGMSAPASSFALGAENYIVPDSFLLVLDMDEGTLGFAETNGKYLGTAFRGMNVSGRRPLYPMISAVWGHAEVTINYVGGADRKFRSVVCRVMIYD